MALHDDYDTPPIPPEVMNPDPGDDQWVDQLADLAAAIAVEDALDPGYVGQLIANQPGDTAYNDNAPARARSWRVTDDGSAEWAMAHLVDADTQLAQLEAQAEAWAQRIQQWFDHRAKPLQAKRGFFTAHLERYALELRDANPKAKTLVLPSGAVKTTEQKPKATVADEAAVVRWAVDLLGKIDTGWLNDVAPEQPRKLYVQKLRDHTSVVEVVDHAQLILATGELVDWYRHGLATDPRDIDPWTVGAPGQRCPQPGDGWPTPAEATTLVARVEVLASHLEVHGPDGLPVPGADVDPGGVTVKVVPAP